MYPALAYASDTAASTAARSAGRSPPASRSRSVVRVATRTLSAPGDPSVTAKGSRLVPAPGRTATTLAPIPAMTVAYSPSGSMTSTRAPFSTARASSTLTRYDFPAPLVARMTALWFSRANRSTTTGLRVAALTPYSRPERLRRSLPVKGNEAESAVVESGRRVASGARPRGSVESSAGRIWNSRPREEGHRALSCTGLDMQREIDVAFHRLQVAEPPQL